MSKKNRTKNLTLTNVEPEFPVPEPLDVELQVEVPLEVENVKTLSIKCVLEWFDEPVDLVCASSPLLVTADSGKIGYANVYVDENNRLMADLVLEYSTPERLLIETGEKLYAYPGFFKVKNLNKTAVCNVYEVRVTSVCPGSKHSPLGKPVL